MDSIITTFNISQSYFSSPITCSTTITQFYSPHTRDTVFGSLASAFQYKWRGIRYAHPPNIEMAQQTIHWARLAAQHDPYTITLLIIPDNNWYQIPTPYKGPFLDTHVITHFSADTITYDEPIPLNITNTPLTEPLAIRILCIHHQNYGFGTINQLNRIETTIVNMQIPQYHMQITPPTPPNIPVNKSTKWNKLTHPPSNHLINTNIPTTPNFEINTTLKFPPQYSYYTDGSFVPPKQARVRHWKKEKKDTEYITQQNQKYKYQNDYHDYKPALEQN